MKKGRYLFNVKDYVWMCKMLGFGMQDLKFMPVLILLEKVNNEHPGSTLPP